MRRHFARKRKVVFALSDYYFRYEKTDNARYVSHLDFVRMFGRAMRRAHLPIAFSEGFNPHPLIGFALPLSVGYTSQCELIEISLTESLSPSVVMDKLNSVLPCGVRLLSAHEGKSRMKKLDIALYRVKPENMPCSVAEFLENKEIIIDKKTKSGIKETDIRGDIKEITLDGEYIYMTLSAGSRANLKPETVIKAMEKYIDGYTSGDCDYHRLKIFDADMKEI